MMHLCKTVHSLLGFPDPDHRCQSTPRRCRHIPSASHAAGLRCLAGELPSSPPHVVESAAVGTKAPRSPSQEGIEMEAHGLGCLNGRSGGAGLELCTESLGFESCCDGRVGTEERLAEQEIRGGVEEYCKRRPPGEDDEVVQRREERPTRRRRRTTTQAKQFPPPLPSLGANGSTGGRPSFFLKAVKRDGRLVLTEVRVEWPQIFRAPRQDGRLRLELVNSEPEQMEEEQSVEEEKAVAEDVAEVAAAEEEEVQEDAEEKERWWQVPAVPEGRREGGELGRGRCQEVVRGNPPPAAFWNTRFVTTA